MVIFGIMELMRVIFVSIFFVILIGTAFVAMAKWPEEQKYIGCYEIQKASVRETDRVIRRTFTSEVKICGEKKEGILKAYSCLLGVEEHIQASDLEIRLMKSVAKTITRTSRDIEEVIADHNRLCTQYEVEITDYELEMLAY